MEEAHSRKIIIFGWADTPWTVAALLGAWGVMIGIEEFFLADVFMVLAGVSCTARLAKDSFQHHRRRWIPFVLWIAIIVTVVGVDIHLTARKRESSEAKAGEIPKLNQQIRELNGTIQAQGAALTRAQGHTDQHVSDIQDENKQLRASIDKKDAALVSIAKQQFALNFFPQVFAASNDSTDTLTITNNGKTNVTVEGILVEGRHPDFGNLPALVTPPNGIQFKLNDVAKTAITQRALGGKADRLPIEGEISLSTLNKKKYSLKFVWYFDIKDGAIVKSYVVDRPIVEIAGPSR